MREIAVIETRLRDAGSLPDLLVASFEAFEAIRKFARASEDKVPGLFAAFMTVADAAVDGREGITIAPSLPPPDSSARLPSASPAGGEVNQVTDVLATLGGLLSDRLTTAAAHAVIPADKMACERAAAAAQQIHHLMAREPR